MADMAFCLSLEQLTEKDDDRDYFQNFRNQILRYFFVETTIKIDELYGTKTYSKICNFYSSLNMWWFIFIALPADSTFLCNWFVFGRGYDDILVT